MAAIRLIDFSISEDLNNKFLKEIKKFDSRIMNILIASDFLTLEKFRSYIYSKSGNNHLGILRGVGTKTEETLINLFRKTLQKVDYSEELRNFNREFNKLSSHAKNALDSKGISVFEIFYYVYFVKKQPVCYDDYPFGFARKEIKEFIKSRCKSIRSFAAKK